MISLFQCSCISYVTAVRYVSAINEGRGCAAPEGE